MFPSMSLVVNLLNLTILVDELLVNRPHVMLVHPNVVPHAILKVDRIKPVDFIFFVSIIIQFRAVVFKPSKGG